VLVRLLDRVTSVDDWQRRLPALVAQVDSALAEEDWDTISALLDDYFFALSLSMPEAVNRVWESLPDEWLRTHPRYLMAAAITTAAKRPFQLIGTQAERAFAEWVAAQESPATRDVVGVKLALVRRHMAAGSLHRAGALADEISDLLRDAPDHDGFDDVLPSVFVRLGMVRLASGEVGRAVSSFAEAWRWSQSTYPHPFAPIAAAHCALAYALASDYVHAQMWRGRSEDFGTVSSTAGSRLHTVRDLVDVLLAVGSAKPEAAERAAHQLDHGIERGELWWVAVHARSRIARYWGDRGQARREITAELHAYPSLTAPSSLAGIVLRCDLADLQQAELDLDAAGHTLADLDQDTPHPAAVGTLARQLMLRGDLEAAHELLSTASKRPLLSSHPPARWEVLRVKIARQMTANDSESIIDAAVQRIVQTGAYDALLGVPPDVRDAVARQLTSAPSTPGALSLTPREKEILDLLAEGLSLKDLAEALFISPNTAKSHLSRLYRKLGVTNRTQAVMVMTTHPSLRAGTSTG
jgi:DNA-binding NarL/FixJ family response regulator